MTTPRPTRPEEGTWPADCVQRAFVDGAKWWEFRQSGATMWPADRDLAEAEAVKRYGEPAEKECSCPFDEPTHAKGCPKGTPHDR